MCGWQDRTFDTLGCRASRQHGDRQVSSQLPPGLRASLPACSPGTTGSGQPGWEVPTHRPPVAVTRVPRPCRGQFPPCGGVVEAMRFTDAHTLVACFYGGVSVWGTAPGAPGLELSFQVPRSMKAHCSFWGGWLACATAWWLMGKRLQPCAWTCRRAMGDACMADDQAQAPECPGARRPAPLLRPPPRPVCLQTAIHSVAAMGPADSPHPSWVVGGCMDASVRIWHLVPSGEQLQGS
jgi:hypothetical protein